MFTANLINSMEYYRLQRFLWLGFLASAVLGITVAVAFQLLWFWTLLVLIPAIALHVWKLQIDRKAQALARGKQIEVSDAAIRVLTDSGQLLNEWKVADASGILVKETYAIPAEGWDALIAEAKGNVLQNYLVYQSGQQDLRYDFVIESNYKIGQLQQVIRNWRANGVAVKVMEQA